jgi:hypothetical protein
MGRSSRLARGPFLPTRAGSSTFHKYGMCPLIGATIRRVQFRLGDPIAPWFAVRSLSDPCLVPKEDVFLVVPFAYCEKISLPRIAESELRTSRT